MPQPIYHARGMTRADFGARLRTMTADGLSIPKIGEHFDVSAAAIFVWMRKFGIERRRPILRDRETLRRMYVDERKSAAVIAKEIGCTGTAVQQYLQRHGIEVRDKFERQRSRNREREISPFHRVYDRSRPRSYCFWFDGHWFASAAEYVFYARNAALVQRVQPFVFRNRRPDFLMTDSCVVEVKGERRSLSAEQLEEYEAYGRAISAEMGLPYRVCFVDEEYKDDYRRVRLALRGFAQIGSSFSLLELDP